VINQITSWCEFLGISEYEVHDNAAKFGAQAHPSILAMTSVGENAAVIEVTTHMTMLEKSGDFEDFANFVNSDPGLSRLAEYEDSGEPALALVSNIFCPQNPNSVLEATMLIGYTLDHQQQFVKIFEEEGPQRLLDEVSKSGLSPYALKDSSIATFPRWVDLIHKKVQAKIPKLTTVHEANTGLDFDWSYEHRTGSHKVLVDFFVTNHPIYGNSLDLMFVLPELEGSASSLPRYLNQASIENFEFIGAWSFSPIVGLTHRTTISLDMVNEAGKILLEKGAPFEPEWLIDWLLDSMMHQLDAFSVAFNAPLDWINHQKNINKN